VQRAWRQGFTVQSDFARKHAVLVGKAASCAFITTQITHDEWGTTWRVTPVGLDFLWREIK
jgi:hypothetical protein